MIIQFVSDVEDNVNHKFLIFFPTVSIVMESTVGFVIAVIVWLLLILSFKFWFKFLNMPGTSSDTSTNQEHFTSNISSKQL